MPRVEKERVLKSQHSQPSSSGSRGGGGGKPATSCRRPKDEEPPEEVLAEFRAAASRTCDREFWSKSGVLAKRVVRASLAAAEAASFDDDKNNDASAAAALASARRVIKEASQNPSLDCLCVGIHCLRAVSASHLMRKVNHQEAVIKVLYHTVVTAEAAHDAHKDRNNGEEEQDLAFTYGLLAYNTLGRVLQQGGYSVSSKRGRVHSQFVHSDEYLDENQPDGTTTFCVPTAGTDVAGGRSGDITPDLVCTIAITATMAVCRMLLATIKRRGTGSGEFTHPAMLSWSSVGSKRRNLVATLSHLSCGVLPSWIAYLEVEASKDDESAAKEVVSTFKRIHLLLSEAADNESDPIRSLQLRAQSLVSLLCCANETYRPSMSVQQLLVSKGHFEVACTMARKAVTVRDNVSADKVRSSSLDHAVVNFHAAVGSALDALAVSVTPTSTAYVDYCAQRALDGVRERQKRPYPACSSSCLFRKSRHIFGHSNCANSNEAAVVSLFFVTLAVRDHLNGIDDACSPIVDDSKRIIQNFEAVALVGARKSSIQAQEATYRSFHLLWNLKLHAALFDAVNAMSDPRDTTKNPSVSVAADILALCVGPLASIALQNSKPKAVPQLGKAVLESFSRGIAAYEALALHSSTATDSESASYYSQLSEETTGVLVEKLLKGQKISDVSETIEKGAKVRKEERARPKCTTSISHVLASPKVLSVVARRRQENSSNPLLHLSLSLRLYAALDDGPGLECSNRMSSSRWLWLSSLYSSMDRSGEEALCIAVALHYLTLEKGVTLDGIDSHTCTLQLLCAATKGVIPAAPHACEIPAETAKIKGLVSRLISICSSKPLTLGTQARGEFQLCTPTSVSEFLVALEKGSVNNGLGETCGLQVDMVTLLDVVFSSATRVPRIRSSLNTLHVATILAFVETLGKRLQTVDSCEDDDSVAKLYSLIVERGSSFIHLIGDSDVRRRVLLSVFYVCASVGLFSQHALFDFDFWNVQRSALIAKPSTSRLVAKAGALVDRATALVATPCREDDETSILARVLRQLLAMFQFQLETIQGISKEPVCSDPFISILGQLADIMHRTSERTSVHDLSRWWLMSLLSRVCDSSAAEGEKIQALQFAIWNLQAAGNERHEGSAWLEATALSLQALDTAFVRDIHRAVRRGETGANQIELKSNTLRWKLKRTLDHNDVADIEEQLLLLLSTVDSWIAEGDTPLLQWAKSTTLLGLSEVYHKMRRFDESIHFAGDCFKVCRVISHSDADLMTRADTTKSFDAIATATLLTRSWIRRVDCLQATSQCYWSIGDRFKSASYADQALRLVSTNNGSSLLQVKLPDFIACMRSLPVSTSTEMQCRRLLFLLKARSTSWDMLIGQFKNDWHLRAKNASSALLMVSGVNHVLEEVNDLESVLSLFVEGRHLREPKELDALLSQATSSFSDFQRFPRVLDLSLSDRSEPSMVAPVISHKLKLAIARRHLFEPHSAIEEGNAVLACEDVVAASTDCECQAGALYCLGLIALKRARRAGDLARLWSGYSNRESDASEANGNGQDFLGDARKFFTLMLPLLGPTTECCARDALRCLALATGPCSDETAEMVHASIGSSLRRIVARRIEKQSMLDSPSEGKVLELLKSLDIPFGHAERKDRVRALFSTIERLMPVDWRVTACALCPSGEMLITSMGLDALGDLKMTSVCIFPEDEEDGNHVTLYDAIMVPLDKIISANQEQLQNAPSEDTLPKEWWSHRKGVDSSLQALLADVESTWFASEPAQLALLGDEHSGDSHAFHVNLASKFEAASKVTMPQNESFDDLCASACTLLVLDENLQRFPFESMPMFEGTTVCRQPSLPFLAVKLWELSIDGTLECQPACVDMQRVRYVLDPESDLSATTNRLQPFLESIEKNWSGTWQHVVREAPSKRFIEECLSESDGLYLFFGHGNGHPYFSKSDVESLLGSVNGDAAERRVRASVVLMGCSSGRLESVNRKNTKLLDRQLPLYHEPEGLALCYVGAGAPCVVGNLWDVTDRDIDSFAMEMLQRFVGADCCTSLAECVAQSRRACKLRYGTGSAPVCYGIPVIRKHTSS